MRRWATGLSVLLNLLLIGLGLIALQRLGGYRYALYRLSHPEAGLYAQRKSLFSLFPDAPGALVMLGDSQIEQCEWRELLGDSLPIRNRGISGDNIEGVSSRLGEVMRHQPRLVMLCVGLNDLLSDQPIDQLGNAYENLVHQLRRQCPASQLVLCSVLPVNNSIRHTGIENSQIGQLNAKIRAIATRFSLPYLDLFHELGDADGKLLPACTPDGVHLNAQGYLIWKKQLDKILLGL